jgi:N-acetylneuraminic acid mutarotase
VYIPSSAFRSENQPVAAPAPVILFTSKEDRFTAVHLNTSRFIAEHGLNDLHVYDPVAGAWTDLSAAVSGTPPLTRWGHGFTFAGGKLYVFGGWDDQGDSPPFLFAFACA